MGLLNHLFGGKKGAFRELKLDEKKRFKLWEEHLKGYSRRDDLSKFFKFNQLDSALQDFSALLKVLAEIEASISKELVELDEEERLDEEILKDLERLASSDSKEENYSLSQTIRDEEVEEEIIRKLFEKIHDTLKIELEAIRLIREKPDNVKDTLAKLFRLICHNEDYLYQGLSSKWMDKEHFEKANKVIRAVLLEQELKEELYSDEEKFINSMVRAMDNEESAHEYRKLGEEIYDRLAEKAGAPVGVSGDILAGIERLKKLTKRDSVLYKVIKDLRPKFTDEEIRRTMKAFRKAYNLGHFISLEEGFAT